MAENVLLTRIPEMNSVSDVKPWKCKGGHMMGMVVRDSEGVQQLLLLREAVHEISPGRLYGSTPTDEIDVMAVVEGYVADVRCSICRRVRTWVPGEDAIEHLLAALRQV